MLTKNTYARLKSALIRKSLADEFQALLTTPGTPSVKLAAAIKAMMANKKAANEIIVALSTAGNQTLSGPANPNAKRRLINALCRKTAADEIDALL